MTVASTTNQIVYTGDDATSVFAYTFKIFADTDLVVTEKLIADPFTETVLTITTDYTVSGVGVSTGGNVTLVAGALAATKKLIIQRVLPLTQGFDLAENDNAPSSGYEDAYDKLTMMIQTLDETLQRAIRIDPTQTGIDVQLPPPEADKGIAWNSDADGLVNIDAPGASADAAAASAAAAAASASSAAASASAASSSASAAAASAVEAAASVATLNLPTLTGGDAGKRLVVNSAEDGYDLVGIDSIIKGWVHLDGTGTAAIDDSFNVSSITDNSTGNYTVTWDTDFASVDYVAVAASSGGPSGGFITTLSSYATGSVVVQIKTVAPASVDDADVCVIAIGDQ